MVPKYVDGTPFVSKRSMPFANVCKITIIMYQIQIHTQDVVSINPILSAKKLYQVKKSNYSRTNRVRISTLTMVSSLTIGLVFNFTNVFHLNQERIRKLTGLVQGLSSSWSRLSSSWSLIRKTCPCGLYPLTPHFYIAKLGFKG